MAAQDVLEKLKLNISQANLPQEISEKLNELLNFSVSGVELQKLIAYAEFAASLPFGKVSTDILDIDRAKQILDQNHYGLKSVKVRILEYLAVLILHGKRQGDQKIRAPILLLVGLVGTGKTTLAYSIADALGRKIVRIPFGGLGNPLQLRGQSRVQPDAEPGQIIKAIKSAGFVNPVILLDEIDRIAESGRVDMMGVLVELLDPAQNHAFLDHYLDFPYDLSQVLFIATANNTANLATAVMDRLEPIQMPSYSDEEKIIIGQKYLLPKAVRESGLEGNIIQIDDAVWPQVIRPLGYDAGIRSLDRALQGISRKVALKVVEGQSGPFKI